MQVIAIVTKDIHHIKAKGNTLILLCVCIYEITTIAGAS